VQPGRDLAGAAGQPVNLLLGQAGVLVPSHKAGVVLRIDVEGLQRQGGGKVEWGGVGWGGGGWGGVGWGGGGWLEMAGLRDSPN
jgi:hypothetical protein